MILLDQEKVDMQIPNPINPDHLSPKERLAGVCGLLARGMSGCALRNSGQTSATGGEFRLH